MKRDSEFTRKLTLLVPGLIICFCVIQPMMDVLAFWKKELGIPDLLLTVLRFCSFAAIILAGFLLSRRKKLYLLFAGFCLLYLAGHILAACGMGYQDPVLDLTDQLRVLILPAVTAAMMTFLDRSEGAFRALKTGLIADLGIFLLVAALSELTGRDPHTYLGRGIGVLGWFLWPNSQSAILSMLAPLSISWSYERFSKRVLPMVLTALISFGLLFLLGTRLAFVTIPLTGVGMAVSMLIADREARRPALALLLLTVLLTALYPLSPMRESQLRGEENEAVKQERVDAAVASCGVDPGAGSTEDPEALAAAYHYFLQGVVDRFGIDRTARAYDYTLDQAAIFDGRRKKLVFNELLMEDASELSHWFGLEISRMHQQTQIYDFYADSWTEGTEAFAPENDLHGIYYTGGWVLLAGILGWMLWYGLGVLKALLRNGKRVFTVSFAAFCCAYCFFLIYAYTTNSVLRQTRNTFCVSAVLSGLWYLSRRRGAESKEGVSS